MHAHPHRQSDDVINRLARIEGHVRSVKQMADSGKACSEILLQVAAVQAALRRVSQIVLEDHLDHCILHGDPREAQELLADLKEALAHYGKI